MSTAVPMDVELNDVINSVKQLENIEVEATDKEFITLEQTTERIPLIAWFLILCQLCKGFIFFGTYIPDHYA